MTARQARQLVAAARLTRARAYAPYSRYTVGAAVLDERGRVHAGCNVENASYGLTICAERNAVGAAVAAGARRLQGIAVVTRDGGAPCGACRQVLLELAAPGAPVVIVGPRTKEERLTVEALLPRAFSLRG
jgi:cytidine deaminase